MGKFWYAGLMLISSAIMFVSCGEPRHPQWCDKAVVYELNIRQFTSDGTIAKATTRLNHLKMLGVNTVVLTPVQPIGVLNRLGKDGNPYSIQDYISVNPDLGTIGDFRDFVDEAHRLGIRVILDWVGGHTSRDAVWLDNMGWHVMDESGEPLAPERHMDGAKLNYANMEMRGEMVLSMHYWLREGHIDGFRCCFSDEVPVDFWEHVIRQLHDERAELLMITDADYDDAAAHPFNISTSKGLYNIMLGISKGKADVARLREYISTYGNNDLLRMNFTSNHEENQWNGTEFDRMGDAVQCMAMLAYLLPDIPMVSNGQEVGLNHCLDNLSHDPIDWHGSDKRDFLKMYRTLNKLKAGNRALNSGWSGGVVDFLPNSHDDRVLAFVRESSGDKCMAIINLSPAEINVDVHFGEKHAGDYISVIESSLSRISESETVTLKPWQVYILSNC